MKTTIKTEVLPGLISVESGEFWSELARQHSTEHGGLWFSKLHSMTHINGSQRTYYVRESDVPAILSAMAIAKELGVSHSPSVGSCAFAILKWMNERQVPERNCVQILDETGYGYQDCQPGELKNARQYDVSSYYYSLWSKLPSVRCHVIRGRIVWQKASANERAKWADTLAAVKTHKLLRNALVGSALGRRNGTRYYHRGEVKEWKGSPGPFRNAAAMVVRSGWEITRTAAEDTGSRYSNVDCVIVPESQPPPRIWERLGFTVRTDAIGDAEVCSPGIYRVGEKQTGWYARGSRFQDEIPRSEAPEREYYSQWL